MTRIAIFLSVFASTLAAMIIMPILAPLIRAMGLSESQGGRMISIGSIVMAVTGAWWGAKSDHRGRKAVILARRLVRQLCRLCRGISLTDLGKAISQR